MSITHRYNTRYQARKAAARKWKEPENYTFYFITNEVPRIKLPENCPKGQSAYIQILKDQLDAYHHTEQDTEARAESIIKVLLSLLTCRELVANNPKFCKVTYERCNSLEAQTESSLKELPDGTKKVRYNFLSMLCKALREVCLNYM